MSIAADALHAYLDATPMWLELRYEGQPVGPSAAVVWGRNVDSAAFEHVFVMSGYVRFDEAVAVDASGKVVKSRKEGRALALPPGARYTVRFELAVEDVDGA